MANTITVTTSTLTKKSGELKGLNDNLKKQITTLREQEKALNSMWDGEANTAFHNAFEKDATQMDNFYNAIEKYVTSLNEIIKAYEAAEKTNLNTISSKKK